MERRSHGRDRRPRPDGAWLLRTLRRHGRPSRLRLFWWALVGLTVAAALAFQASAGDPNGTAGPTTAGASAP